jgi:hypothetical protein
MTIDKKFLQTNTETVILHKLYSRPKYWRMNTKGSDMSWFERPMKAVVTIYISAIMDSAV